MSTMPSNRLRINCRRPTLLPALLPLKHLPEPFMSVALCNLQDAHMES